MLKRFLKNNILGAILTILLIPGIVLAATLIVPQGGTGLTTCSIGGLLKGNGQNPFSCISIGTEGQVLTVTGGTPTWSATSSLGITSGGSGDVISLATSTDNAIARFDGTTGKFIQNSRVTIDDFGNANFNGGDISGVGGLTISSLNVSSELQVDTITSYLTDTVAINATTTVPDRVYGSDWNGSNALPTRNALWDKIESLFGTTSIDTEAELETILTDVTNVYTNNDGNLNDDNLSNNTTSDLAEGSNLYHTLGRIQTILVGGYNAIFGNSTTTNLSITSLTGCDTLDTDSNGKVICGTDATGSSGGGSISTSTIPTPGHLAYWTSNSALGSVATGTLTETATGLEFSDTGGLVNTSSILSLTTGYSIPLTASTTNWNTAFDWGNHAIAGYLATTSGNWTGTFDGLEGTSFLDRANHTGTQLAATISDFVSTVRTSISETITGLTYTSGTGVLSLDAGYVIPLTASTTEWSTAYASTTNLTPTYIRNLFSNTATGLTYTAGTGVTALTAGYNIPLSASTTNWNTFYDTPSTRITAGTNLSWSGNTLNATGGGSSHATSSWTVCSLSTCDFVTDGTADEVQINQALSAASSTGGVVQLFAQTYDLSGAILLSGLAAEGDGNPEIKLVGMGREATKIYADTNLNAIEIRNRAKYDISKLTLFINGSGNGIKGFAGTERGNWQSNIEDIYIVGDFATMASTSWGIDLQSPFRMRLANVEMNGVANGANLSAHTDSFNPGNLSIDRMFIDLWDNAANASSTGLKIGVTSSSSTGVNNLVSVNRLDIAGGTNLTNSIGVHILGSISSYGDSRHHTFTNMNIEDVKTAYKLQRARDNTFLDLNYTRVLSGGTVIELDSNSHNNKFENLYAVAQGSGQTYNLITDSNGSANLPNFLTRVDGFQPSSVTINATLAANTILEQIDLSGGTPTVDTDITNRNNTRTFQDVLVTDEAYGVGWNGILEVATKNALYDKIEALVTNLATQVTGFLGIANGGTGTSTAPTTDQILVGNAGGTYDYRRITAGTNVTISTSTTGQIQISSTASGSSGGLSTTTPWTNGNLAYVTGLGTVGSVATGTLTETVTGLEFDQTRALVGGSAILSLTSGFSIPSTTDFTNWNIAYASTTNLTPTYIRSLFSNTATGLTYTAGTGATALTAGYSIPLTASTTEWHDFNTTPSTRITANDGLTWSGNNLNFDGGNAPGGELGGTWASPTLDDSVAVTGWNLTTPTLTSFFGTPCTSGEFLTDISDTGAFTCAAGGGGGGGGALSTTTDIIGDGGSQAVSYVEGDVMFGGSASTSAEFQFDDDGGKFIVSSTSNSNATATLESSNAAQAVRLGDDIGSGLEYIFSTVGDAIIKGYGAVTEMIVAIAETLFQGNVRITGDLWVATTTYNGATTTDSLVIDGFTNSGEWIQEFCTTPSGETTAVVADTLRGCGRYAYIEDAAGQLDFVAPTTGTSSYFRIRTGATGTTNAAGDGFGFGWGSGIDFGDIQKSQPAMEWAWRTDAMGNATSAIMVGGITDAITVSANYAVEPGQGFYVVGSSTQANWQFACNPSTGATTYINTNIATSTVTSLSATTNNTFVHWRLEVGGTSNTAVTAILKARTQSNQNFTEVGSCTINTSASTQLVAPTIGNGRVSAGTLSAEIHLMFIKFWYKQPVF